MTDLPIYRFASLLIIVTLAAQCADSNSAPLPEETPAPTEIPTPVERAEPFVPPLETGQVLRYPISVEPEHLDPFRSTTIATRRVIANVFEGLVTFDPETGGIKAELAESWDISENGRVYTFHLKRGVRFQQVEGVTYAEGREVKAEDWVWSWKVFLSGDTALSAHPEYLAAVRGAADFSAGEADDVAGLEALDDYTLEITLTGPDHRFLFNLVNAYVVPREAYEQLGAEWEQRPVGTGPFLVGEWQRGDYVTLVKNPDYHEEGLPLIDQVRFLYIPDINSQLLQYRANRLDLLFDFPPGQLGAIKDEFGREFVEKPGLSVQYYGFKWTQPPFRGNPDLRKAFAYAVDRGKIWNGLMNGAGRPGDAGLLPPEMPAAEVEGYAYDPKKAREHLTRAGYPGGEGLEEVTLYYFSSAPDEPQEAFQEQLAELGVEIKLQKEDSSTYWTHIGQDDVKLFLSGWSADYADPGEFFDYLFYEGRDDTHYTSGRVDEFIQQAAATVDEAGRNELYRKAHERIMDDCPLIVSSYGKIMYLQQPWVKDFQVPPAGAHLAPLKYLELKR
jgi:oligopeptide transport system substrate-binding protein